MNNNLTIDDLVDFILQNRRGKAFEGWTKQDLICCFNQAFGSNIALYTTDLQTGKIVGAVLADKSEESKTIYISNILTTHKEALKTMWKQFMLRYPGWKLKGKRHNTVKEFNVEGLNKKLNR